MDRWRRSLERLQTRRRLVAGGWCLLALLLVWPTAGQRAPDGFAPAAAAAQLELETSLDERVDPEELLAWNRELTPAPHHVGAEQTKRNAEWLLERFRSWGYEAEIERYDVLVPFPEVRELTLVEPVRFEARLSEEIVPGDATSRLAVETGLPPFNAYSADGDVTGELVYVNRGVPRDYEQLERLGVSVEGKIVIARYGGSWRGIKPKVAAEKGAIACIIFNDPLDDGYYQGEAYPEGAFKHESGVQRGSVLDLPLRPGDPLTPMRGATPDAERLDRTEAETIMPIPVLPIGARDAQPLLEALRGPVAPRSWRGALPITYRVGPGPAKVRLRLEFDWSLRPAYNVVARLEGARFPDQWVMRGNHHDAWVIGARDPISGLIGLLGEAKAVAELAQSGRRPERTIVYAAWDAEEPGLLGSTEWVEHHADELRSKLAVYINTDGNSRGFLRAGGSHALETFVDAVADAVDDPQTGVSVGERLRSLRIVQGGSEELSRLGKGGRLRLGALGSGSDYSPFFQHLGNTALNVGFGGEGAGGEYHTAFDSFDFYRRFVDPGAVYAAVLARFAGRLTLRMANADVLPFDFERTAETIGRYLGEVRKLADDRRDEVERTRLMLDQNRFELAADPTKPHASPRRSDPVPHLDYSPLLNAQERLDRAAEALAGPWKELAEAGRSEAELAELNRLAFTAEQLFTHEEGLPRRPWFRHHVYAPGFYTGYGVKTLPGVREAIEEERWDEAGAQIVLTAERIEAFAERLEVILRTIRE